MAYQLVLQYEWDERASLEALIALEDELVVALGDSAEVDGHDFGSDQANIFIVTESSDATFKRIQSLVQRPPGLGTVIAAYRDERSDANAVICPIGYTGQFKVA